MRDVEQVQRQMVDKQDGEWQWQAAHTIEEQDALRAGGVPFEIPDPMLQLVVAQHGTDSEEH